MFNTIILKKGFEILNNYEMEDFCKGDTIWGNDSDPDEIERWSIDQKDNALEAIKNYKCNYYESSDYENIELHYITEYALEYCECDEDGEFISGSDYYLAEEEKEPDTEDIKMSKSEFEEFMERMDAAEYWNDAEPEEWRAACGYAGIKYKDYDDPDMLWRDLCKAL